MMENVYLIDNKQLFNELKHLIESNPKGYKQMLEAKGRKREPNVVPRHKHLMDWMNNVLPKEYIDGLSTREKCYWILNGLVEPQKCSTCQCELKTDSFLGVYKGYSPHCSYACLHSDPMFGEHISQAQAKALANDPQYYAKKGMKNASTRIRKYGAYFSEESKEKLHRTLSQYLKDDPDYYKHKYEKVHKTNLANGHDINWNNREQAAKTRRSKYNGQWENEETKHKKQQTSLQKYGTKDPNKSDVVKLHKAQAFEKKYGPGITNYFQTQESKDYMKSINEQRKAKEFETKRKNKTFNTSKPEDEAYFMLFFAFPHLIRQHSSDEYPFLCDFYDPSTDAYFECNFSWTHGGHFFDEGNEEDVKKLELWKSKKSKYYDNAIRTWTIRDVKKRQTAEKNGLKYLVFWSIDEVRSYVLGLLG